MTWDGNGQASKSRAKLDDREPRLAAGDLPPRWSPLACAPARRAMDLLIAATAHVHVARLYTRNPADLMGADNVVDVVVV